MKKNEQLYISRCMVDMKHERCSDYKTCPHTKPHEHNMLQCCGNSSVFFEYEECECIPVSLKYYINEILDEK